MNQPETIVHLLRHGEVHNPDGVLYGRRDGFHLSDLGRQMAEKVGKMASTALSTAGVPHVLQTAGSLFSIFFTEGAVTDYDQATKQDVEAYKRFFHSLLSQGVYLPPSAYEAWFVSAAHDDNALDRVMEALPKAALAAAG